MYTHKRTQAGLSDVVESISSSSQADLTKHIARKGKKCSLLAFSPPSLFSSLSYHKIMLFGRVNPLTDMPILVSSNSSANTDMMSQIWTDGDIVIRLSRKHCGKRRNRSL